jgi:hypothetical protein
MSGSPVIAGHDGFYGKGGKITDGAIFGTVESFLGIYSGRFGRDELGAQLGRVWKKSVIEEIIDTGVAGESPR